MNEYFKELESLMHKVELEESNRENNYVCKWFKGIHARPSKFV